MDRFQIAEHSEMFSHAGTKATADIKCIAESLGFAPLSITVDTRDRSVLGKAGRQISYYHDWNSAKKNVSIGSILLLQHPFHHKQLTREKVLYEIKKKKRVKIISVVHDVEQLRGYRYNDYYAREFQTMISVADILIVHNDKMRKWFVNRGISESKVFSLEIFDYLIDEYAEKNTQFEKSISIAGNLDSNKSRYIERLDEVGDVKIHLYGPNYNRPIGTYNNIEYHGSYDSDQIPGVLNRGFGLVWDGDGIEGCTGQAGEYLRYNNPHKLSLYLASGMPVVIWKEAAEADFVRKNELGICISCLSELKEKFSRLTSTEWYKYVNNVSVIRRKLIKGEYAKKALSTALNTIEG